MKPEKIPVANTDFFGWNYEEQTQVKHKVLQAYYDKYAKKVGSWKNTLFFDCHGGCGAYLNNNELNFGSSIIIDRVAQPIYASRTDTKNWVIVCENDKENFDNLNKVLKYANTSRRILTYNKDYNDALHDSSIKTAYKNNATLFFLDPFGYYNTPLANMSELMKYQGNEILINFMYNMLNFGISVTGVDETQVTAYFGCDDWKYARTLSGNERENFLVGLYKRKLKECTGAKFVFAYRLCCPDKDRTYYYLVHATNHPDGITLMKSSFAFVNNGRVEYLGKRNDIVSFFDMDDYKQADISKLLITRFSGKKMSFDNIWLEIVEDTAYLESDLRNTLKEMEKNGVVMVERVTSKTPRGLGGNDIICFGSTK